jgi:hypothetical protein
MSSYIPPFRRAANAVEQVRPSAYQTDGSDFEATRWMGFYAHNASAARAARAFWESEGRAGGPEVLEFVMNAVPCGRGSCLRLTEEGERHRARVERFVNDNYSDCLSLESKVAWADLRSRREGRYRAMPLEHARQVLRQHNASLVGTELSANTKPDDDLSAWGSEASYLQGAEELPYSDLQCRVSRQGECRQMVYGTTDTLSRYRYENDEIVLPFKNGEVDNSKVGYRSLWNPALNMAGHTVAMELSSHKYPLRVILPHDWTSKLVFDTFGTPDNYSKRVENSYDNFLGVVFIRYSTTAADRAAETKEHRPPHGIPVDSMFFPLLVFGPHEDPGQRGWTDNAIGWTAFRLFNYRGLMVDLGDYAPRKRVTYSEVRDVMCRLREPDGPWRMFMVRRGRSDDDYHLLVRPKSRDGPDGGSSADDEEANAVRERLLTPACFDWMDQDGFKAGIRVRDMSWLERRRDGCHFDGMRTCEKTTSQLRLLNGFSHYDYGDASGGAARAADPWRPLTYIWLVAVLLSTAVAQSAVGA